MNAVDLPKHAAIIGNCCLTSVYLEDVGVKTEYHYRPASQHNQGGKQGEAGKNSHKSPSKPKQAKPKRKRAKDFAREALESSLAAPLTTELSNHWLELWDPIYQTAYYHNEDTQESRWEKPDGHIVADVLAPKTPSQTMEMALAGCHDRKAFRAAKREAENYIALLLRVDELPSPEGLLERLQLAVEKLETSLKGPDGRKSTPIQNNQEWDSLQARSTGLLSHIPEPVGSHIRFPDNEDAAPDQTQLCLSQQKLTESGALPGHTLSGAEDVSQGLTNSCDVKIAAESQINSRGIDADYQHQLQICQEPEIASTDLKAVISDVLSHTVDERLSDEFCEDSASLAIAAADHVATLSEPEQSVVQIQLDGQPASTDQHHETYENLDQSTATAGLEEPICEVLDTYDMLKQARIQKYWTRRYSLWSKFDQGIKMDLEGWFSATPEVIARHQAEKLASDIAVDAFGGVGGNAIQLALTCKLVLVSDTSMERLLLTRNNAKVYGVAAKMDYICGDFLKLAPHFQADSVFLSPPWGGPSYHPSEGFCYNVDKDIGGLGINYSQLIGAAQSALHSRRPELHKPQSQESQQRAMQHFLEEDCGDTEEVSDLSQDTAGTSRIEVQDCLVVQRPNADFTEKKNDAFCEQSADSGGQMGKERRIACFLPKTTDLLQISHAVAGTCVEVERTYLNDQLKSITVYHS